MTHTDRDRSEPVWPPHARNAYQQPAEGDDRATEARTTVDEALAAWEAKGPTSLTIALLADALYGVREATEDGDPCRHCGKPPEADGDHSCPCSRSDDDCPDHPAARRQMNTAARQQRLDRFADAIYDKAVDHPMWIGDDGKPLDYLPERANRMADFIYEAAAAVIALADAERAKADA